MFTVNRLGLPKPLRRCLTTTNIIDSSHAGIRQHTNRVSRWQSEGNMRNGLYTEALLTYLEEPGLEIEAMFRRVGATVAATTEGPTTSRRLFDAERLRPHTPG